MFYKKTLQSVNLTIHVMKVFSFLKRVRNMNTGLFINLIELFINLVGL